MPSSSTRSTNLERRLLFLFKLAWTRLHFARSYKWASFITNHSADLLDMSRGELVRLLSPTFNAAATGEARMAMLNGREMFEKLAEEANKRKVSACVWDAGDALGDVGLVLGQVGREEDGRRFGEWGRMLWQMAENMAEREDREARTRKAEEERELATKGFVGVQRSEWR